MENVSEQEQAPIASEPVIKGITAQPDRSLATYAKEFYLKEYECLRNEIEIIIRDYRVVERNAIIAVGASWAWLFHVRHEVPGIAWFGPCLFVFVGFFRSFSNNIFFDSAHEYLMKVEEAFSGPEHPGGWEHASVARTTQNTRSWTRLSAFLLWFLLLALTVAVGIYGFAAS